MRTRILAAVVLLTAFLASSLPVQAVPPIPASFYGTVTVVGSTVPPDTVVSAWINGQNCGQGSVVYYDGNFYYQVDVLGYDSDSPGTAACGHKEDLIKFHIGGLEAAQTARWYTGVVTKDFNLTAQPKTTQPKRLFLPLVRGS
jgi:hypothetical protein